MTEELSRSARRLLGELRSAQAYVRATAARALPYDGMMRMERTAAARCDALLTELGVSLGGPAPALRPPQRTAALRPATIRSAAPRVENGESTSPAPAPRMSTPPAAPRAATPLRAPKPTAPPTPEAKPPAPRGRPMNTAPQVEDLDDQLTVAEPPSALRARSPKPAPRAPTPKPAARAVPASTVSPSPPRPSPREQAPPSTGSLVSFDAHEPEDPPTVIYGQDGAVEPEVPIVDATPEPAPAPAVAAGPTATVSLDDTPAGPNQSRAAAPATSGLYGGAVPSVRGADASRPRAAAIQLNASGTGGRVVLDDEDEPIEVGEADHDVAEGADGFAVALHDEPTPEPAPEAATPEPEPPPMMEIEEAPPPTKEEIASLLSQAQSVAATGNLHGAAQLYSDVIDMSPEHSRAHVCRGRLYLDLGDYSRAMSDFMVAEDLAPDDPETHVAIGDLYFHRKDYRRAIDYFSSALEVAPEHAMAYCRRGICHYYRKNFRVALEDLLRAQDLQPDIPNIEAYVTRARKKAATRRA